MPKSKPVVYWDSCVFLAWIKDEQRPNDEMAGVYAVAQEIFKKEIILVTSVVIDAEIQQADLTTEQRAQFDRIFDRSNVKKLDFTGQMSKKAGEIRNHYKKIDDGRPSVTMGDAQHLATAIIYRVTEFHTFDEKDKKGGRGLLTMNGNVAGYPLKIMRPDTNQGSLNLQPKKP